MSLILAMQNYKRKSFFDEINLYFRAPFFIAIRYEIVFLFAENRKSGGKDFIFLSRI